jgi:hypothetical protein
LVDLELPVLQLAIFAGQGRDQLGGEGAQLLRVHPLELIVHLHAFDIATAQRMTITQLQFLRDANRRLCTDATPRQADDQCL